MNETAIEALTTGLVRYDEESWRAFHLAYFSRLRARILSRGISDAEVDEVVQGIYLRVLRHVKVFKNERDFHAWLNCLARCEILDVSRNHRRRMWLGECFQQWQEIRNESSESADPSLEEALGCLNENERTLLTRHYVEGWSQEELAGEQGTTTKAVESKLARLR